MAAASDLHMNSRALGPLGPLFFALAALPLAQKLKQIPNLPWSGWFLVDSSMAGDLTALRSCTENLRKEGPSLGLRLNPAKSTITGSNLSKELLVQHGLDDLVLVMEHAQPAVVVLGHPLGPPPFVERMMVTVLTKLKSYHSALAHLQDPQVELYLAKASLGVCRVTHLMREVPGRCLAQGLHQADQLFISTADRITGAALDEDAWTQASLPLRMGGLGLTHCKPMAGAAFTASALIFAARVQGLGLPMEAARPTVDLQEAVASLPT